MIRLIISEPSLLLKAKLNQYIDEAIEERNDYEAEAMIAQGIV